MATVVNLWGRLVPPEQAVISVFDRGFLYGDSVYEVLRSYRGEPFRMEAHLERLAASAERIALEIPWSRERLTEEIRRTLEAAANDREGRESYIRIIVTRGAGPIGLDPALAEGPRVLVIVRPLEQPPPEAYQRGVEVAIVGVRRNAKDAVDPAAKTGNYLNNLLALKEARDRGAYEAIMLDAEGRIAEGSTSNVFLVRGGTLETPALETGILEGVTRREVLSVAEALGVPTRECYLRPEDLKQAEEAFLTSTIREILPVTRVDGAPVGSGRVGEVTRRIMAGFRERTGPPLGVAPF
ncbi:MAG: aminotransferase [Deltaproteobacteria bacterium]|nr:MAG: aminotransferase [Deltaproteobacteria bacterium]